MGGYHRTPRAPGSLGSWLPVARVRLVLLIALLVLLIALLVLLIGSLLLQ